LKSDRTAGAGKHYLPQESEGLDPVSLSGIIKLDNVCHV